MKQLQLDWCELLLKIVIFVISHSFNYTNYRKFTVVDCFQKLLSSRSVTATETHNTKSTKLWIAFENYYIRDQSKHVSKQSGIYFGCELLSKLSPLISHNEVRKEAIESVVVNRFQNYYLRDQSQQTNQSAAFWFSCKLLSINIIFVISHSLEHKDPMRRTVVNCIQSLLS